MDKQKYIEKMIKTEANQQLYNKFGMLSFVDGRSDTLTGIRIIPLNQITKEEWHNVWPQNSQ